MVATARAPCATELHRWTGRAVPTRVEIRQTSAKRRRHRLAMAPFRLGSGLRLFADRASCGAENEDSQRAVNDAANARPTAIQPDRRRPVISRPPIGIRPKKLSPKMAETRPRNGAGARSCTIVLAKPKFERDPNRQSTHEIAVNRKLSERDMRESARPTRTTAPVMNRNRSCRGHAKQSKRTEKRSDGQTRP